MTRNMFLDLWYTKIGACYNSVFFKILVIKTKYNHVHKHVLTILLLQDDQMRSEAANSDIH